MNDRLIAEFIADAAQQPTGKRMHRLISLVAERCATILEIESDSDEALVEPGQAARNAANTIRAAFVDVPLKLSPGARAAAAHALQLAKH